MPQYRKYTSCVKPSDYVPGPLAVSATAFVAAVAALLTSSFLNVSVLVPLLIALDIALISVCYWYLNGRLLCLGSQFTCKDKDGNVVPMPDNQECAIGVIGAPGHKGIFRPQIVGLNLTKLGDDDATMNILLAPGPITWDEPDLNKYWNQEQGYLLAVNNDVVNAGLAYTLSGNEVRFLHCEFEGSGIRDFLDWLLEILAFLVAILLIQAFVPGGAIFIWLLAILAGLLTALAGLNLFTGWLDPSAPGDPTDIDQSLGNLQAGDIVMVSGDWIYDAGHDGWNEIHAVHNCQKICTPIVENSNGTWSWPSDIGGGLGLDLGDKVKAARAQWCCALSDACGAVEGGSETDPGNNWVIHPLVDGCNPPPVIV
jgi:hypothetical protein